MEWWFRYSCLEGVLLSSAFATKVYADSFLHVFFREVFYFYWSHISWMDDIISKYQSISEINNWERENHRHLSFWVIFKKYSSEPKHWTELKLWTLFRANTTTYSCSGFKLINSKALDIFVFPQITVKQTILWAAKASHYTGKLFALKCYDCPRPLHRQDEEHSKDVKNKIRNGTTLETKG